MSEEEYIELQSYLLEGMNPADTERKLKEWNKQFYFLPEDGCLLLFFTIPALEEFNYPKERVLEIIHGDIPGKKELDIILWGIKIAENLNNALCTDREESREFIKKAAQTTLKKLDGKRAEKVLTRTYMMLVKYLDFRQKYKMELIKKKFSNN